jgi:arsenate reductase-like glutaredoxin family protein
MAFDIDKLTGNSRQKLERWRVNYHKIIDVIFEEKCREIDQRANEKLEKQRDEISQIRSTITELIRKQETTMKDIDLLKMTIHTVEEKINKMGQTCFEVVVRPLVLDDSLIHIEELNVPRFDLSNLPPPYKTINRVGDSSTRISSNDRFFLIHQEPNLCLMDRKVTVIKRSRWDHDSIFDMCWSSTLARFFIITQTNIFTVDENTMSIEPIQIDQNQNWFSCTCSDTTLFLSTANGGSSILIFSLYPSIQFEKKWTSPQTCASHQIITNIAYKNETLTVALIDCRKKEKWIELRSSTTLEQLWSLKLDIEYSTKVFRCCSLTHGDWLAWNYDAPYLLHITKDEKLQIAIRYNERPRYIIMFDEDQLAISTENGINFHKIKTFKTNSLYEV